MRVKIDNLQLCEDCMSLHETGDATALDYHYGPSDAKRRLKGAVQFRSTPRTI